MSAPSDFQLNSVPEDMHLPPSPPRRLKPEIYQNPDVFKNVDDHAIAVSWDCVSSFMLQKEPSSWQTLLGTSTSTQDLQTGYIMILLHHWS